MAQHCEFVVFHPERSSPKDFVAYWSRIYPLRDEPKYAENIDKPFTAERVHKLFEWKNGGKMSSQKLKSVQRVIEKLGEVKRLDADATPEEFLALYPSMGMVWRIFWLHCWQPARFPIYDQHVHRTMTVVQGGKIEELDDFDDATKLDLYLNHFLPFASRFSGQPHRQVDQALWAFGKFMKSWPIEMMRAA